MHEEAWNHGETSAWVACRSPYIDRIPIPAFYPEDFAAAQQAAQTALQLATTACNALGCSTTGDAASQVKITRLLMLGALGAAQTARQSPYRLDYARLSVAGEAPSKGLMLYV